MPRNKIMLGGVGFLGGGGVWVGWGVCWGVLGVFVVWGGCGWRDFVWGNRPAGRGEAQARGVRGGVEGRVGNWKTVGERGSACCAGGIPDGRRSGRGRGKVRQKARLSQDISSQRKKTKRMGIDR